MKSKILLVILLLSGLSSVQAALALPEGISCETADFLTEAVKQINSIQDELAAALAQALDAEKRAQAAEARVAQLAHDKARLMEEQSQLLDGAVETERQLEALQELFDERGKIISKLQKEKEKAAQELAEASGQVKRYEDDLEASRQMAADLRKQQAEFRKETQRHEEQITALTAQLEDPSSFVGGTRSRSQGKIVSCYVTPETTLNFEVIRKEIEAAKEETTKQLAQVQLQKAEAEESLENVSKMLATKDEEIAVLQKKFEKSQAIVGELQKFKEAEEEGCIYVTENDVPDADSLAVERLDELKAMGEKIANQITRGRLLDLINRLRAMKAPWESKK